MAQRRGFGSVRKLPSGRWQARFTHPRTGKIQSAQTTFATKADAGRWLATMETDLDRGDALDLDRGKIAFGVYGKAWLDSRGDLRPKTVELYRYLFRQYLDPLLGGRQIGRIDSESVRTWYGEVSAGSQSGVTTAKAYRLLRQILEAAVDDRLLRSNPCNLKGAAVERSEERPLLSMDDVIALAEAIKPRYRLMVLFAGPVGLRRGECLALRMSDLVEREGRSKRRARPHADLLVVAEPDRSPVPGVALLRPRRHRPWDPPRAHLDDRPLHHLAQPQRPRPATTRPRQPRKRCLTRH